MADSENVTVLGEYADKFDALVAYDEKELDNWVEGEGYSLKSMVLASTAKAFMTFSKGFVDVGRIGNGVLVEGGVKGVGKDALRALNLVGDAGAAINRGAKLLRIVQVGNTCAPVAQTNALRLAGQRFFITVEELARKSGLNLQAIAQAGRQSDTYTRMMSALQAMNVPFRTLAARAMAVRDALAMVRANPGGVVTFSIRSAPGIVGKMGPHRLYATWSRLGGLAIRDPNYSTVVYRSLAELEAVWGNGALVSASPMIFIPNALLTTAAGVVETLGGLGSMALQVLPLIKVPATDAETAVQALSAYDEHSNRAADAPVRKAAPARAAAAPASRPAAHAAPAPPSGKYHTVVRGDWLSKLAEHYYGNMHKWPVIFAANRRTIGRNPDRIEVGQRLLIPNLPNARLIAAVELAAMERMIV